jgi:hypothetical protein
MSGSALHPILGDPSPSPPGIYRLLTHSSSGSRQGARPPPPGCYGSRSRCSGRVPAEPYPPPRDLDYTRPVTGPNTDPSESAVPK